MDPHDLGCAIFETLDLLGQIACLHDKPFGLRGFPEFAGKLIIKKPYEEGREWEEQICLGLRLALENTGRWKTDGERRYPDSPGVGDMIVWSADDPTEKMWIEVKLAFFRKLRRLHRAEYWYDYSGTLHEPDGWHHSVLTIANKDYPNLVTLKRRDAAYVGILLLGFEQFQGYFPMANVWPCLPDGLRRWTRVHEHDAGRVIEDAYHVRAKKHFKQRYWFWWNRTKP
ncbi:MAG TPA: hypothetical protein VHV55_20765 [Pirellulales bacterium]|nr:hypothetical protein [Pirellulales bacterium]